MFGLYPETELKQTMGSGFGSKSRTKNKISLAIETAEDTVTICEGNSKEDIESVGQYLSHYLGYPLK